MNTFLWQHRTWIVAEIDNKADHLDMVWCPFADFNFFDVLCFFSFFYTGSKENQNQMNRYQRCNEKKNWIYKLLTFNVQNWLFICNGSDATENTREAHKTIHWKRMKQIINGAVSFTISQIRQTRKWLFRELIAFNHLYRTSRLMNVDRKKKEKFGFINWTWGSRSIIRRARNAQENQRVHCDATWPRERERRRTTTTSSTAENI